MGSESSGLPSGCRITWPLSPHTWRLRCWQCPPFLHPALPTHTYHQIQPLDPQKNSSPAASPSPPALAWSVSPQCSLNEATTPCVSIQDCHPIFYFLSLPHPLPTADPVFKTSFPDITLPLHTPTHIKVSACTQTYTHSCDTPYSYPCIPTLPHKQRHSTLLRMHPCPHTPLSTDTHETHNCLSRISHPAHTHLCTSTTHTHTLPYIHTPLHTQRYIPTHTHTPADKHTVQHVHNQDNIWIWIKSVRNQLHFVI